MKSVFTVHEGKFNLSTAEVANISAAFKDVGLNINPAINLDLLSTAIGEGNVDVGVLVTPRFTSLCFNISIPLKLLEVFEETLSMSIAFTYTPGEMKPPQSPQPQFVFDPLKIGVSNFEKFSQEVLSSFNNLSEMMVITAFLGFTALMAFA